MLEAAYLSGTPYSKHSLTHAHAIQPGAGNISDIGISKHHKTIPAYNTPILHISTSEQRQHAQQSHAR